MATTRSYRLNRIARELELAEAARRRQWNALEVAVAYRERSAPGVAPVEPAELVSLFAGDDDAHAAAWLVLALMTPAQRVHTAIEVACWLEGADRHVAWGQVLARWERRLAELGVEVTQ